MGSGATKIQDLVLLTGTNVSNIIKAREAYEDADAITMEAVNVTDGVITYTVEVTQDLEPSAAGNWATLQDAGADFAPPLAGKAKQLPAGALATTGFRVKSSANVTANRTFGLSKAWAGFGYRSSQTS